jgi:hypothetical protein
MNKEGLHTRDRKECEALLIRCEQLRQEIQGLKILEHHKQEKKCQTLWQWFLPRPVTVIIVLMMVGVMGTGAWGRMITLWGYYNGKIYKQHIDQIQMTYVSGVVDGISYAVAINNMKELSAFNNFVHERPALEIKSIADRYMKAHPEEWQDPMASIIFEAVMTHFKELNP